jgi:hypothetical protein
MRTLGMNTRSNVCDGNVQMVLLLPALLDLPLVDDERVPATTPNEPITHIHTRAIGPDELPVAGREHEAPAASQQLSHGGQCGEATRGALGVMERVAHAEHHVERRRIEVVGQLIPAGRKRPHRDAVLCSELLGPAHHPSARVGRDNVQAETCQADRELPGAACAVENTRVGRKRLHKV